MLSNIEKINLFINHDPGDTGTTEVYHDYSITTVINKKSQILSR